MDRGGGPSADIHKLVVNRDKPMVGVSDLGVLDAVGTVVPVGAVEALMANTGNVLDTVSQMLGRRRDGVSQYLIAAIAYGMVHLVAARRHLDLDVLRHLSALDRRDEAMLGVVAMGVLVEAGLAQVIVFASVAVKELILGKFWPVVSIGVTVKCVSSSKHTLNTAVASAHNTQRGPSSKQRLKCGLGQRWSLISGLDLGLDLSLDPENRLDIEIDKRQRLQFLHSGLGLGGNGLGDALDQSALNGGALDQPVIAAVASDALLDARLAEIKVSIITGRAVVVDVRNGLLAAVAADGEGGAGGAGARVRHGKRGLERAGPHALLRLGISTATGGGLLGTTSAMLGLLGSQTAGKTGLVFHQAGKSGLEIATSVLAISDESGSLVQQSRVVGFGERVGSVR